MGPALLALLLFVVAGCGDGCSAPPAVPDAGPDVDCTVDGCGDVFVCDATTRTCRTPVPCPAGCADHERCDDAVGDAICTGTCDDGYVFVADACVPVVSCDPDAPGSIVDDCDDLGRVCADDGGTAACGDCAGDLVEVDDECVTDDCDGLDCEDRLGRDCVDDGSGPVCGDCAAGFVATADGTCLDLITCADAPCASNEVCVEATPTTDRVCAAAPSCLAHQVVATNGSCVACNECFSGTTPLPGATGVANDQRLFDGRCVCALQPGFFQDTVSFKPTRCDADGDGWVTDRLLPLRTYRNEPDNPLVREQQCAVRLIDRFELVGDDNSARTASTVTTKAEVSIAAIVDRYNLAETTHLTVDGVAVVELVEPALLDVPAAFADRYLAGAKGLQPYRGVSTSATTVQLTAAEANPLTKACNDDNDDLNLDLQPDVKQTHEFQTAPSVLATDLQSTPLLYRMAYFIELNRGHYADSCVAGDDVCIGRYVITEKKRQPSVADTAAGLGLELTYDDVDDDDDQLTHAEPQPYWQECRRSRSPAYAGSVDNQFNMDFAAWSDCATPTGECLVDDGHVSYDGRTPNLAAAVTPLPAADTAWPGMNHSSQFKCVTFNSSAAADVQRRPPLNGVGARVPARTSSNCVGNAPTACPRTTTATAPGDAGQYTLIACDLGAATDAPLGGIANPRDPQLQCAAVIQQAAFDTAAARRAKNWFIGLRDTPEGDAYRGGCIKEDEEWPFLCTDTALASEQDAFGRLACGCSATRGGAACDVACAASHVLGDRHAEFGETAGFWMCGVSGASSNRVLDAGGFKLVGGVPSETTPTAPICASGDCNSGFALRPPTQR